MDWRGAAPRAEVDEPANRFTLDQFIAVVANKMVQPRAAASILMCVVLGMTYLLLPEERSVDIYRAAAIGAALAIGSGILMGAQRGIRSLMRTDLLMLVALYGLTLVEFFFPQETVEHTITAQSAIKGVEALFLGFVGLIIGANLAPKSSPMAADATPVQLRPSNVLLLYLAILCLGYLPMLISVGFDPVELVNQMLGPRFSQPWSRGQLGGWGDLLGEVGNLLLYLIPAIAGSVVAHRSKYTALQIAFVLLGLAFTFFYAFSAGTRNVFAIYLIIFSASYVLFKREIRWRNVALLSCLIAGSLYVASYYMLQFRQFGLAAYIESGGKGVGGFREETLFIDNNLPVISLLTDAFPNQFQYLGSELAYFAILRPVPRVLWSSKPESLSVEAADVLGLKGVTISSTFVGEAYMMGGYPTILVVGLLLGWLGGWWNRFGQNLRSPLDVALYASGFFAAAISMRSLVFLTTAMLPSFAIWLYLKTRKGKAATTRRSIYGPKI